MPSDSHDLLKQTWLCRVCLPGFLIWPGDHAHCEICWWYFCLYMLSWQLLYNIYNFTLFLFCGWPLGAWIVDIFWRKSIFKSAFLSWGENLWLPVFGVLPRIRVSLRLHVSQQFLSALQLNNVKTLVPAVRFLCTDFSGVIIEFPHLACADDMKWKCQLSPLGGQGAGGRGRGQGGILQYNFLRWVDVFKKSRTEQENLGTTYLGQWNFWLLHTSLSLMADETPLRACKV